MATRGASLVSVGTERHDGAVEGLSNTAGRRDALCGGSARLAASWATGVSAAAPEHLQAGRCEAVILQYDVAVVLLLLAVAIGSAPAVVTTEFDQLAFS